MTGSQDHIDKTNPLATVETLAGEPLAGEYSTEAGLNSSNFSVINTPPELVAKVDLYNKDAIFIIKKIRASKTLAEFNEAQCFEQYDELKLKLFMLMDEIKEHPKANSLVLRTAHKRATYIVDFMRREYDQQNRILKARAKLEDIPKKSTKLSSKLVAKFIIDEAIKLNLKSEPNQLSNLRVSTVPQINYTGVHKLVASLVNNEPLPIINNDLEDQFNDVDPLDGMDESL